MQLIAHRLFSLNSFAIYWKTDGFGHMLFLVPLAAHPLKTHSSARSFMATVIFTLSPPTPSTAVAELDMKIKG